MRVFLDAAKDYAECKGLTVVPDRCVDSESGDTIWFVRFTAKDDRGSWFFDVNEQRQRKKTPKKSSETETEFGARCVDIFEKEHRSALRSRQFASPEIEARIRGYYDKSRPTAAEILAAAAA